MRNPPVLPRVRISIDRAALVHNLRRIRMVLHPNVKLMLVVKKNAYGHGSDLVARTAERHGVDWLGVFDPHEGIRLRAAGIRRPILVFSVTPTAELSAAIRNRLTLTVTDRKTAKSVDRAAARLGERPSVHLKLDTGMGRLGFDPEIVLNREMEGILGCRHVRLDGVYSHLADADADPGYSRRQLSRLIDFIRLAPCRFRLAHLGASGSLPQPELHLDMVRVGIAAYGGHPTLEGFRPVMRVTAPVLQVKELPAGRTVSYGRMFRTRRRSRIAIVGAGYGDGYPRALGNRGWIWLRGRRAPIAGRVCMDQFMVDVTRVPGVAVGDSAELIGPHVCVADLAEAAGSISYELLCSLGNRGCARERL